MAARPYATVGGRRYPLKTAAERQAAKRSTSSRGRSFAIPRPGMPRIPAVYRQRLTAPRAIARRSTSLGFLLALIIGIDLLRRWPAGHRLEAGWPIPNMRGLLIGYIGFAMVTGVAFMIAPGFTSVLVGGIVAIQLVRAAPAIGAWAKRSGELIATPTPGRPTAPVAT